MTGKKEQELSANVRKTMLGSADTEHYAWVLPIYTSLSIKAEETTTKIYR